MDTRRRASCVATSRTPTPQLVSNRTDDTAPLCRPDNVTMKLIIIVTTKVYFRTRDYCSRVLSKYAVQFDPVPRGTYTSRPRTCSEFSRARPKSKSLSREKEKNTRPTCARAHFGIYTHTHTYVRGANAVAVVTLPDPV